MSDILIRDIPNDVLAALDTLATRLGLSRSEYIRRRLTQDAEAVRVSVTEADLQAFAQTFGDLEDSQVMSRAWDEPD